MHRLARDFLYPRGGWARAFHYVKHRVRRLPDSPHRIARGIWAGVFASFTPFYGLHFVIAAVLARLMGGNIVASLLGTFFGNPLTYVPIGVIALKTGHLLLGTEFNEGHETSFGGMFLDAGRDLRDNFLAIFSDAQADWHRLTVFYDELFIPYLVGGIIPGAIAATICYYIMLPLVRAYQHRRRKGIIAAKLAALKKNAPSKADGRQKAD